MKTGHYSQAASRAGSQEHGAEAEELAFVLSAQVTQSKACCRATSDCPRRGSKEMKLQAGRWGGGASVWGCRHGVKLGMCRRLGGKEQLKTWGGRCWERDTSEMYTEMTQRL